MKPTYAEAVALHSELTGIIAKAAAEGRELSDNEKTRVVEIQTKSHEYQAAAVDDSEGRRTFLANIEKSNRKSGLVLKASDSFADHFKTGDEPELSLAKSLRGYLTGEWDGAEIERKAMASSALGAILPTPISNQIIDLARNASTVIRAGAVTVPMTTATLKLARMTGDVTAAWYAEAGAISESDATLDSVTLTARNYAFTPNRIEIIKDDLVSLTIEGADQVHSFAIDEFRIAKRIAPGNTVTIEFRADRAGSFNYYCNIAADPGCKAMRGTLVVAPR